MSELAKLIAAVQRGDPAETAAVLESHPELVNQRDPSGATALHYAAFGGYQKVVEELVKRGADINAADSRFGATPTGWAIEYLREMGGLLAIEIEDMAHAIQQGDVQWVARFLHRFPALQRASNKERKSFEHMAQESGNRAIAELFTSHPTS
jgi:ankyrin repeat protein